MKQFFSAKWLLVILVGVTLASCSKNQKVVKDLEGTWRITHQVVNDTVVPDSVNAHILYEFEKCKVKKEDCPGTIKDDQGGSFQLAFTYTIEDKGETIVFKAEVFGIQSNSTGTFKERSDTKMVIEEPNDANGNHTITTLEKQ